MLTRMRDLAVQSANSGANDLASRQAAQAEITQLSTEITRVSTDTKFGGTALLDGTYGVSSATLTGTATGATFSNAAGGVFTINIAGAGATTVNLGVHAASTAATTASDLQTAINAGLSASGNAAQQAFVGKVTVSAVAVGGNNALKIDVAGLTNAQTFVLADGANTPLASLGLTGGVTAAVGTGGKFQIGANSGQTVSLNITNQSSATLGINALDVTTDAGAASAITALDNAIGTVSSTRGTLGAMQNRFESMINNLQVTTENISASESRIRDTDMAQEMVSFTKNQVLMQAGTAMLSQANQIPQSILSLLR
jgi:flagellin